MGSLSQPEVHCECASDLDPVTPSGGTMRFLALIALALPLFASGGGGGGRGKGSSSSGTVWHSGSSTTNKQGWWWSLALSFTASHRFCVEALCHKPSSPCALLLGLGFLRLHDFAPIACTRGRRLVTMCFHTETA